MRQPSGVSELAEYRLTILNSVLLTVCLRRSKLNEPEEFINLSTDRRITLQARIQQARSELAIEASPDGKTDKRTGEDYQRTIQYGDERYENLMISDYKESHVGQASTNSNNR